MDPAGLPLLVYDVIILDPVDLAGVPQLGYDIITLDPVDLEGVPLLGRVRMAVGEAGGVAPPPVDY